MQYFRAYSRGRQLMYFILLIFTFLLVTSVLLAGVLPKAWGISPDQLEDINEKSTFELIRAAQIAQGVSSVLVFFLPGFLFAYLAHPRPMKYLGLVKPGKYLHFVLVLLVMLGAMPVLQLLEGLIGKINFGEALRKTQEANDNRMNALLHMPDIGTFFIAFLIMAIVPGICEEVFFRGIMMRFAKVNVRNMVFPIIFTALVFAMAHTNVYGFLPIFIAGAILGILYYLTGSLWCSVLAHVFFNGSQIILSYLTTRIPSLKFFSESTDLWQMAPWAAGGAVLFCISFYLLWKNRTPLPGNWPIDLSDDEIRQIASAEYP